MFQDLTGQPVLVTESTSGIDFVTAKVISNAGAIVRINNHANGVTTKKINFRATKIAIKRFKKIEELALCDLFFASHAATGHIARQILDVNGGKMSP